MTDSDEITGPYELVEEDRVPEPPAEPTHIECTTTIERSVQPNSELFKTLETRRANMLYEERDKYYVDVYDPEEQQPESMILFIYNRCGTLKRFDKFLEKCKKQLKSKGLPAIVERIESPHRFEYKIWFKDITKPFCS